jgi:hypothetical protein
MIPTLIEVQLTLILNIRLINKTLIKVYDQLDDTSKLDALKRSNKLARYFLDCLRTMV